jgi:hypothetical protein
VTASSSFRKLRPRSHQFAALFEKITATVCRLHFVSNRVRERHFDYVVGEGADLSGPIAEGGPKPMDGDRGVAHATEYGRHRHIAKTAPAPGADEDEVIMVFGREAPQQRDGSGRERDAVFPPHLHSSGGDGPNFILQIDFGPSRTDDLSRPRGGKD